MSELQTGKQNWQREFNADEYRPPQELIDLIEFDNHVFDESWHNDMCPHLSYYAQVDTRGTVDHATVDIWWDAIKAEDREMTENLRFQVDYEGRCELTTDDVNLAMAKFRELITRKVRN